MKKIVLILTILTTIISAETIYDVNFNISDINVSGTINIDNGVYNDRNSFLLALNDVDLTLSLNGDSVVLDNNPATGLFFVQFDQFGNGPLEIVANGSELIFRSDVQNQGDAAIFSMFNSSSAGGASVRIEVRDDNIDIFQGQGIFSGTSTVRAQVFNPSIVDSGFVFGAVTVPEAGTYVFFLCSAFLLLGWRRKVS
ncbi:hypothetical protein [Candidatus Uabimicrobium amorphum]|uniref:Uncharacterized protein n=1 Tax=Uabimicrobium amorphum TaxID=2596890 RepID=A0A5S9F277_UABAM|nr:hypothetical protein [Candidatus Uabimicrobium amorphum]BBM83377.1 hypothetical protein UABAM_01729 [Candidatus Uabimicrobium amorphum]